MKTELGPNGVTLIKECFSGQYKQVVLVKLILAKDTQNNSNYLTWGGQSNEQANSVAHTWQHLNKPQKSSS